MTEDLPNTMDLFYDAYATDYDPTDMGSLGCEFGNEVNQFLQNIHHSS